MITLTCPTCAGKSTVGDEFTGRKIKCPKCGTRVRHQADGSFEILSVGQAPPPAAPPPPAAAPEPAPAGAPPPAPGPETPVAMAIVPELAGKLLTQGESKQNTLVVWGVVGFLALALAGAGVAMGDLVVAVAPIALALVAAFVWLGIRAQKRRAKESAARPPAPPRVSPKDEEKTEPIPKA